MAGLKGMEGDPPIRGPMSWAADAKGAGFTTGTPFRAVAPNVAQQNVAAQVASPTSIHAFYKRMLKLRNTYPSLASGSYVAPFVQGQVLGYQRSLDAETTLVLINYAKQPARVRVPSLPARAQLLNTEGRRIAPVRANAQGQARVTLLAQSVQVFAVSMPSKP